MAHPEVLSANDTAITLDTTNIKWFAIFKADAIELAKHFKLTEEDLK